MDDLGSGMTDPKPLVNIKQALSQLKVIHAKQCYSLNLKDELKQMDIRTGVLSHCLLHAKMKNGSQLGDHQRYPSSFVPPGMTSLPMAANVTLEFLFMNILSSVECCSNCLPRIVNLDETINEILTFEYKWTFASTLRPLPQSPKPA